MKKSLLRVLVGILIAGAVTILGPTVKSKPEVFAESNSCQLKSLSGIYGFPFAGYFGDASPFIPVAGAGMFTFRPDGTLLRHANGSFGGGLFTVSDEGSYVLNADCSFTANVPGETWELIPVDEGKQLEFFINTPLRTAAGTMTRQ